MCYILIASTKFHVPLVMIFLFFIEASSLMAYAVDPHDTAIEHNNTGINYAKVGMYDYAIEEFKIALMISPYSELSSNYYNNLGEAYHSRGDYDRAIQSFLYALKQNASYGIYFENLVKSYQAKGVLEQAKQEYEEIISYNNQDAEAYLILGLIHKAMGNRKASKKALEKILPLSIQGRLGFIAKDYLEKLP